MELDLSDDVPAPISRASPSTRVPAVQDVIGNSLRKIGSFGQLDYKQQVGLHNTAVDDA